MNTSDLFILNKSRFVCQIPQLKSNTGKSDRIGDDPHGVRWVSGALRESVDYTEDYSNVTNWID